MTERTKALLAVTSCMLFWGLSFISTKVLVAVYSPMTIGALRFALGSIFLFFIKQAAVPGEKLKPRDIPMLAGAGLIGVTMYFFCENNGIALISASEASIITAIIPCMTMATESLLGKFTGNREAKMEKHGLPGILPWIGAFISVAGVFLVAGVSLSISGNALGYIYMAGACISWVAYCFLTKPLFARHSRLFIVFWQSAAGFVGFLPFALIDSPGLVLPTWQLIGHFLFLGIFCSALGYWFYARSLEVLGMVSSIFINFIPVVTVIAGFFILHERLTAVQWAGAALVLAGVYLAVLETKKSA
jgi:drug/metabolite transporter (DMT)-like permease